jgi:hypothetical protein
VDITPLGKEGLDNAGGCHSCIAGIEIVIEIAELVDWELTNVSPKRKLSRISERIKIFLFIISPISLNQIFLLVRQISKKGQVYLLR